MSIPNGSHNYRTFASFINSDPELLIFRRFGHINVRNLLYLQSELISLEARLKECDEQDAADGTMDVMLSSKCWETLETRAAEGKPREAERMKLIRNIELARKRYSMAPCCPSFLPTSHTCLRLLLDRKFDFSFAFLDDALILQSQVLRIGIPEKRVWSVFSNWFQQARPFVGHSRDLLLQPNDFLALPSSTERDAFSSLLEHMTGFLLTESGSFRSSHYHLPTRNTEAA